MSTPSVRTAGAPPLDRSTLLARYHDVRRTTERLCAPLSAEDHVVQAMADVSPTKWHLAHVSWFFDTFLLEPDLPGYMPLHPAYRVLFNSYYNGVGPQFSRPDRGHLSRPSVAEIHAYRTWVDRGMATLLEHGPEARLTELAPLIELGLNHEQQHQELILTDIKYNLSCNPLQPAYRERPATRDATADGLATIDDDVPAQLAAQTIASIVVLGALRASPKVKAALADRIR